MLGRAIAIGVLCLLALQRPALGGRVNITNGITGDGHLDIDVDDFGSYGRDAKGTGGGTQDDQFQAGALVGSPTFTAGLYVFITDPSNGKRTAVLLSSDTKWLKLIDPKPPFGTGDEDGIAGDHNLSRVITAVNTLVGTNGAQSVFQIVESGGGIKLEFTLTQKLNILSPGVTQLDQKYVIKNIGTVAVDLAVHAHTDPDLLYNGDETNDIVGVGLGLCFVYCREPGSLRQVVTLGHGRSSTVPLASYYGGKSGVEPGNGPPAYGAGTDVIVFNNRQMPLTWRNNIATGGYDVAVESGSTPGLDVSMGIEYRFSLAVGAEVVVDPERVYGTENLNCDGSADLAIAMTDAPDPVVGGGALAYTINVTNNGPTDATAVTVTDTLPAGVTFVSASGSGWTCSAAGQVVTCTRAAADFGAAPPITINTLAPSSAGTITNTATVSASEVDSVAANNSASTTTTVVADAELAIAVSDSPDPVNAGATLTYTVNVTNNGPQAATSVSVSNTLPLGVTFVSATGTGWSCAAAGQVVTCTQSSLAVGAAPPITITTTAPSEGGTITDTATVTATTNDPVAGNNSASTTTTVTPRADLAIAITDSPDPVIAAGALTYTINVTNNGPSTAASVSMTNTLPVGVTFVSASGTGWTCAAAGQVVTCTRASLAPGAAPAITIATTAPTEGGAITDTATITTTTTDPVSGNNSATATTTVTASADLAIAVSDSPDPVTAGQALTYTVTVTNLGPSTATSLSVSNTLPAGVTFVSATGTGWTCTAAGQVVTCTSASLAPGASAPSITIATTAPAEGGSITNTATISAATGDPVAANNTASTTTSVTASADLAIAVTDAPDPVTASATLTYTISATNLGPSTAATVSVTNTLPAGVTFVSASGTGWTCSVAGQVVTCTRTSLAPGSAPAITITTKAPSEAATITDTATITSATTDPVAGNNSASATTTVTASADLAIAVSDAPDPVPANGTITYTIGVTNLGPSTAASISVSNTLPAGVAFVSASGSGWSCTVAGQVVTCTLASLAPGAAPAITMTATAPADGGTLTDTATVSAATGDPVVANNTASATTTVAASADLAIAVSDTPDPVTAGDALTYTIDVTNLGPSTASGVVVSNTLPAGTTFVSAVGTGWTCTASGQTVTCTRATLATGAAPPITISATAPSQGGSITDTATVSATTADPVSSNNTASTTTTVSTSADLAIAITDSPDPVVAGAALTYTINVTNAGPSTADALTVTNTLPAGVTFVSATGTGWTCSVSGQIVTCARGTLAVGSAPAITIATTAPSEAGTITDTATVAAATTDPATGNNSASAITTVTASADLAIAITDSPDPVAAGSTLTYTVDVTNLGPSTAGTVTATITLPATVTFVSAAGTGWTCGIAGSIVTCTRGSLAPGGAPAIAIAMVAPSQPGTITGTASIDAVTADPVAANNTASATTTVTAAADLAIAITDSPDPVIAGGALTYTIVVTNNGPSDATSVAVANTLPTGVVFASATGSGWSCSAAGQVVTCTRATLAAGATAPSITISTTAPSEGGTITDTATVSSAVGDPVSGNNTATATTDVTGSSDLAIALVGAPNPVTAAQQVTYTVSASNLGPSTADTVVVTNTLPAGATFVAATGDGWTCSAAGQVVTCTRASLAPGAAPITITAMAPPEGGTVIDTASITAATADPVTGNNSASTEIVVIASADLAIAVTAAPDPVPAGGTVVYTISATNNGPSTADSISVTKTLDASLTFVGATGVGWSCGISGLVVTCTSLAISPGTTSTIAITATAPLASATVVTTTAVDAATGEPNAANNLATTTITVNAAACGDGIVNAAGEQCDTSVDTADCNADCTMAACGDGYANAAAGEPCDSGGEDTAECNANCTAVACGDSRVNTAAGEQCDGGGVDTADCNANCTASVCGDGFVNAAAGEECDTGGIETAACFAATCLTNPDGVQQGFGFGGGGCGCKTTTPDSGFVLVGGVLVVVLRRRRRRTSTA